MTLHKVCRLTEKGKEILRILGIEVDDKDEEKEV